ncbi:MAG: hypothetical protein IKT31_04900 [Firmicutes bacterium]|nr:hypothetical protein [Bacillota bacterium]
MKNSKFEQETELFLDEYAGQITDDWAAEMDKYLAMDENAEANFAKYGKHKYVKPQRKILRYAAIFLIVCFIGSFVIPIPQASAWKVWWMDFLIGINEEDVDVSSDREQEFLEYYVAEIPKGFTLVNEMLATPTEYIANYANAEGKYIVFMQTEKNESALHLDNENRKLSTDIIGDFEALISTGEEDIIFGVTTENSNISVQTDAGFEVGKTFLQSLKKIS